MPNKTIVRPKKDKNGWLLYRVIKGHIILQRPDIAMTEKALFGGDIKKTGTTRDGFIMLQAKLFGGLVITVLVSLNEEEFELKFSDFPEDWFTYHVDKNGIITLVKREIRNK